MSNKNDFWKNFFNLVRIEFTLSMRRWYDLISIFIGLGVVYSNPFSFVSWILFAVIFVVWQMTGGFKAWNGTYREELNERIKVHKEKTPQTKKDDDDEPKGPPPPLLP